MRPLRLRLLDPEFTIVRLDPDAGVPAWAMAGPLWTVTRSSDELSMIVEASRVPEGVRAEAGWRAFGLMGPFPFTLTGVLASVLGPLADAGIPILATSTFDTDYVFVADADRARAAAVLAAAGHTVEA